MVRFLSGIGLLLLCYGCTESSGREPGDKRPQNVTAKPPQDDLRVGRDQAMRMRGRRNDDASAVKISVSDLMGIVAQNQGAGDSLIFYFVKYDRNDPDDRRRYLRKSPNSNWGDVARKGSSLLVGVIPHGATDARMLVRSQRQGPAIPVYDLGVVCPPPPNCGCEIRE